MIYLKDLYAELCRFHLGKETYCKIIDRTKEDIINRTKEDIIEKSSAGWYTYILPEARRGLVGSM